MHKHHEQDRVIRAASEADLPAILDLYAETGLDDGVRLTPQRASDIFTRLSGYPDYRILVVTGSDGKVVASYALLIMDNIAHVGAPLAVVEQVAVAANHRGAGHGTFMMRHAMAEAQARGCYKLALSSNVRFTEAHAFYDRLGFKRHGFSFLVDLAATGPEEFDD